MTMRRPPQGHSRCSQEVAACSSRQGCAESPQRAPAPEAATCLVSMRRNGAALQGSGSRPGGVVSPHPLRLGLLNRSAVLSSEWQPVIAWRQHPSQCHPQAPHFSAAQVTGAQGPISQAAARFELVQEGQHLWGSICVGGRDAQPPHLLCRQGHTGLQSQGEGAALCSASWAGGSGCLPSCHMPSAGGGPADCVQGPSPDLPVQDLTACSACSDIARGVVQADLHTACSPVSWENHPSKQSMRTGRQPLTPGLISTLSTLRSTPWYRWPSRDARVCRQQQTDVPGLPGWCAGHSRGSTPQQNGGLSCQRSCPAAGPCSQAEPHVWPRSVQSLCCEQGSEKELQSGGLQAGQGQAPLQAWRWRFSPQAAPAWLQAGTTGDPEPHGMAARSLCRPSTGVQACPPQSHHRCTSKFCRCTLLTLATLP